MDIRLYNHSGEVWDKELVNVSEIMETALISRDAASGLEVIGNKVVKFLLTTKGSDAFDPEYGSTAFRTQHMSINYIPKFRIELDHDVERCLQFIKKSQRGLLSTAEKLINIVVVDVRYDPFLSPDRLDVYLELRTNKKNRALVALKKSVR